MLYFASLGPVVYLVKRNLETAMKSNIHGVFRIIYYPAIRVAKAIPPYKEFVDYCSKMGGLHSQPTAQLGADSNDPYQ